MDWTQISLALIIPLVVSVIVWMLTYIVPYIWPNQVTRLILALTGNQDPQDPIEIGLIVNQFLKYDDWKRLTAKGRLKRIFFRKMIEIEQEKADKWEESKQNLTYKYVKDVIDDLNSEISSMDTSDKINEQKLIPGKAVFIDPKYLKDAMENFKKETLQKDLDTANNVYKENKKAKYWFLIDYELPINLKKNLSDYGQPLTSSEIAVLMGLRYPIIDIEGSMTKEQVLTHAYKEKPPKTPDRDELSQIFDDLIFYIDYPHDNSKENIVPNFVLGLSDNENSSDTLLNVVNHVQNEIDKKDFAKIKRELGRMF